jgi:AraC family transcriptional regulator of adaptative response/methylated-DNA-[protein]-cysteine methyltransferase
MERQEIGYRTARCALGWLLVAGTPRGVCAVMLGDAAGPLEQALRREFPWAALGAGTPRLDAWTGALVELAAGRGSGGALPLDVRGSRFQRRVWQALRAIPAGETRSYGQLARELGQPRAARAVARACATNPVALAIPCHRVVGGDGALRGYRWDPQRKQALLEREKVSDLSLSGPGLPCANAGPRSDRVA